MADREMGEEFVEALKPRSPRYALTRGSIFSGVQKGAHTRVHLRLFDTGECHDLPLRVAHYLGPEGQPGDVSVMSTVTLAPSTWMP